MNIKLLSCMSLLALMAFAISCNSDDNSKKNIDPVVSIEKHTSGDGFDELVLFFDEYLPTPSTTPSEGFFTKDGQNDKVLVIDSPDEFRASFNLSPGLLPSIDFESYTLIIGQAQVPNSYHYVVSQHITKKKKNLDLNLTLDRPDEVFPAFSIMYYWGLYPKLKQKTVNVSLNHKSQ